jgi:hypothetical protein
VMKWNKNLKQGKNWLMKRLASSATKKELCVLRLAVRRKSGAAMVKMRRLSQSKSRKSGPISKWSYTKNFRLKILSSLVRVHPSQYSKLWLNTWTKLKLSRKSVARNGRWSLIYRRV